MKKSIIVLTFLFSLSVFAEGYQVPSVDMPGKDVKAMPQGQAEEWENSYRVQDQINSDRELASDEDEIEEPGIRNPSSKEELVVEEDRDKIRNPSSKGKDSKEMPKKKPAKERVKYWKYNSVDRH